MPVGGGGLSAGVLKYFENNSQYSLIEPLGGASLWAALIAGRPVPLDKVDTFADGAAVGQIGNKPFETLKSIGLANVLRAPEDRVCITMLEMLNVEELFLNQPALFQ